MPFINLQSESPGVTLGIWRIVEDEEFFLSKLNIYENEARILSSISHPLKRLEWLSSRLCLKELLNIHHKVESLNRVDGKPYLSDGSYHISYSHSNLVSGAIASTKAWVSIDLEDLTKTRNPETRKLFMGKDELDYFEQSFNNPKVFYLFWSAKETLYKIHPDRGLIFRENLILKPQGQELKQKGRLKGIINKDGVNREYEICYEFFPDFILTYTLDPVFVQQSVS